MLFGLIFGMVSPPNGLWLTQMRASGPSDKFEDLVYLVRLGHILGSNSVKNWGMAY